MSFVYGIDPQTLSREYEYNEVIALAKAAVRFLSNYAGLININSIQRIPISSISGDYPDRAGFRESFGSHYKTKLE